MQRGSLALLEGERGARNETIADAQDWRGPPADYLKRAERAGLSWPLPDGWSEADLEQRLFRSVAEATRRGLAQPDWPSVHRALKRKGVTLALVWEDYRAAHPEDGYGYSRFAEATAATLMRSEGLSW